MNDTALAERPAAEKPALKVLSASALVGGADFTRTYRQVIVDPDTTLADICRPGFWRNHANKFGVLDLVDVLTKDGALDVQLRVIAKEPGLVHVRVLRAFESREQTAKAVTENVTVPDIPANYIVNHTPATLWRVWTKQPSTELKRGFKSKAEAAQWAVDHSKRAAGE